MIIILNSKNGQFYNVVKSPNGKTLFTSETFKKKATAQKNAKSLQKNTIIILDHTKK